MKKLHFLLAAVASTMAVTSLSSCGTTDNSDKIQIAAVKLGYGTDWLTALTRAYTEKTGVEFYYQEVVGAAGNNNLDQQLRSLSGSFDIYALRPHSLYEMVYSGSVKAKGNVYETAFEPLTDIFTEAYEGESGNNTMEKKMDEQFKNYVKINGEYFAVPWSNGFLSFVRNLDVWTKFGYTAEDYPRTTDELFEMMDAMKAKASKESALKDTYPMIYCASDEYYTSILGSWFSQYEGEAEMEKFYNGKNPNGKRGTDMFTFDGITESLKVLDELCDFNKEKDTYTYQHPKSKSLSFTQMQNYFLLGAAAFCVNGTWLDIESPAARESNIDYIKIPLISSIVNNDARLTKKYTEAQLREAVTFIDAHPTVGDNNGAPSDIVAEDLEVFREARNGGSYMRVDYDHLFVIPSWANKKPEAKKFLKWIYSDEGLNIYYKTMQGHHLPALPSTGSYDNTGVTQSQFRKSVNKILDEGNFCPYLVNTVADKIFSVAHVQSNISNTISKTGNCLKWMVDGFTPDQVVAENTNYLVAKWSSILNCLDKE